MRRAMSIASAECWRIAIVRDPKAASPEQRTRRSPLCGPRDTKSDSSSNIGSVNWTCLPAMTSIPPPPPEGSCSVKRGAHACDGGRVAVFVVERTVKPASAAGSNAGTSSARSTKNIDTLAN